MSKQKRVLVIAEAGVNHNGNLKLAKKLINIAKRSGADVVKFQTFDPSEIVTTYAKKAKYQNKYTKKKQTQYHMLKKLTLSPRAHNELNKYAKRKKILYFLCLLR